MSRCNYTKNNARVPFQLTKYTMSDSILWRTSILPQLLIVVIIPSIHAVALSEYAVEDLALDEIIVNAANSSKEFEFFYDEKQKLLKLEYDIVHVVDEWEGMNGDEDYRKKRTAAVVIGTKGAKRWTGSQIPYEYNFNDFSDKEREIIESAMDEWSRHTCLTFEENVEVDNRILFKNAGGCFSRVGMVGGAQVVGLAKNCRFKGVLLHELGHAIGLHHEQTRPDRDQHVRIVSKNIPEPMKYNFKKYSWETLKDLEIPYDYSSIMHYGKNAFSMNGKATIVTINPKMSDTIGQKHGLSFRDIKTVNIMYGCKTAKNECTKTDTDCPGEGFVAKDCQCWCPGDPLQLCTQGGGDKDGGGEPVTKKKSVGTEKACEDQHKSCEYWAGIGECAKNPPYMLLYCKLSCKVCGQDKQGKAKAEKTKVVETGATQFNPGVLSCQDHNYLCDSWSKTGECSKNPAYMNTECKLSCGLCGNNNVMMSAHTNCVNQDGNCQYWANMGECTKNPAYMHTSCRKSCQLC